LVLGDPDDRVHIEALRSMDVHTVKAMLTYEAIMVLQKPSSLLIEHDGLIHFDECPLDHRLRQSVPLQYLIIERHEHFELGERCLPEVLV
jgi:hypothetical protein